MNKISLLKNHKSILYTAILCLVSTALFAQDYDYLQMTKQRLAEGNCEKAQENYRVYKKITGLSDYELERQIKDCFNKGKVSWREKEERSEILIHTITKFYYKQGNQTPPTDYNSVWSDVKRDYPNRMIGIQKGTSKLDRTYDGWWYQGNFKILEPNIRYYLNEAIRSANDGSRIALNQISFMGGADESLENQLMDILFDEGFRVVNSISNADYYINVKMDDNSLQIRMVNAVTGEYEGVSSVKYDGFIDEIKIGKGGECTDVEKTITFVRH